MLIIYILIPAMQPLFSRLHFIFYGTIFPFLNSDVAVQYTASLIISIFEGAETGMSTNKQELQINQ